AISIDFDPKLISYDQLLGYFWNAHRCDRNNSSRQYMNAVFYQNDEQRKIAETSRAKQAKRLGISVGDVQTEILPVREFTYAENYHQKYYLTRYSDFRDFLSKTYPDAKSLADSTVATRLNAYLGSGMKKDWKAFLKELPSYDLPDDLRNQLEKEAKKRL
ncbi:MAG: peptide-methionine (S)-S-oxide reductase, partial [Akkermansiaceae bacterium]